MRSAVLLGSLATTLLASLTLAQTCPPAPRNLASNDFFDWCTKTVNGRIVPGPRDGDLMCVCDRPGASAPNNLAPAMILFVGLPVTTAAVFAGIQAMSEASQSADDAISGAEQGKESQIGKAAVVGAAVGLGAATVGWTITKIAKWDAVPAGAPWWRRTRLVTGIDRRGAAQVGFAW